MKPSTYAARFRRYHKGATLPLDEDFEHFCGLVGLIDDATRAAVWAIVLEEAVARGEAVFTSIEPEVAA